MNTPITLALLAVVAMTFVAMLITQGHIGAGCVSIDGNAHGAVICSVGFGK